MELKKVSTIFSNIKQFGNKDYYEKLEVSKQILPKKSILYPMTFQVRRVETVMPRTLWFLNLL